MALKWVHDRPFHAGHFWSNNTFQLFPLLFIPRGNRCYCVLDWDDSRPFQVTIVQLGDGGCRHFNHIRVPHAENFVFGVNGKKSLLPIWEGTLLWFWGRVFKSYGTPFISIGISRMSLVSLLWMNPSSSSSCSSKEFLSEIPSVPKVEMRVTVQAVCGLHLLKLIPGDLPWHFFLRLTELLPQQVWLKLILEAHLMRDYGPHLLLSARVVFGRYFAKFLVYGSEDGLGHLIREDWFLSLIDIGAKGSVRIDIVEVFASNFSATHWFVKVELLCGGFLNWRGSYGPILAVGIFGRSDVSVFVDKEILHILRASMLQIWRAFEVNWLLF